MRYRNLRSVYPYLNRPELAESWRSSSAEVGLNSEEFGPVVRKLGATSTHIGLLGPESTKFQPTLATCGPSSPSSTKLGLGLAKFGPKRIRPTVARNRPNLPRNQPDLARNSQSSKMRQHSTTSGKMSAKFGPPGKAERR